MGPKHTLTYSATSTAGLAIGLLFLFGLSWLHRHKIILGVNSISIIISLIILYGTVTPFIGGLGLLDVSEILHRDSTITGRTDLWEGLIPYVTQKFLLGYGIGGFWNEKMVSVMMSYDAHNGYLDTILNIGLIGLVLSSIFLIGSCHKAQREMMQNFDWGIFWFCIVLIFVVHNIAESSLESFTGLMPIIIFMHVSLQSQDRIIDNHTQA